MEDHKEREKSEKENGGAWEDRVRIEEALSEARGSDEEGRVRNERVSREESSEGRCRVE